MTCTTCGRENPPHLTFCQECGQRLGPRIAPPTPPIGLGVEPGVPGADFYAQSPSRLATSLGAGPAGAAGSAQAQVQLAQQQHAAKQAAAQAQAPQGAAAGGAMRACRICATPNGPTLRYCTSCGSTLDPPAFVAQATAPAPSPSPAPAPVAAGAPVAVGAALPALAPRLVQPGPVAPPPVLGAPIAPAPAPFASTSLAGAPYGALEPSPIAPMRVVDLGGNGALRPDAPRMCTRCRGVVDGNAQFCKFCGASLADASPAPALRDAPAAPPAGAAPLAAPMLAAMPAPAPNAPLGVFPGASPGIAPMDRMDRASPLPAPERGLEPPRANGGAPPPARALEPAAPLPPPNSPPAVPARAPPVAPVAPAPAAPATAPPAARATTRGRLVVIAKSGADGPSYPFSDTLDVGRTEGQIIVGEDPYLSPRHVRIAWTGSRLVLRDLASTNGVFVRLTSARDMFSGKPGQKAAANDDKVPGEVAVPLQDQDLILVGQQVLRFESAKDGDGGFGPATEHGTLLFGSPAAPRYARLSQRTVEGVTRDVYYVRKVETVLGRESGDVVFTEDPFLSRRHAAIRVLGRDGAPIPAGTKPPVDAVQFALVDLGSSNGSFLRIRGEVELVPGDHFRVGQQLFRVDFDTASRPG